MRKKVFAIVSSFVLLLSLTACGGEASQPVSTTGSTSQPNASSTVPESTPNASENAKPDTDLFTSFENGLSDLGITYSERVTMGAEIVGGIMGYKYKMDGYNVEVYQFDTSGDAYAGIEETGTVTMEGFGAFPVIYNDGLVMIEDSAIPQEVVDLFNSL